MAREEDISAKRKVLLLDERDIKELQEEVEFKPWKARNLEVAERSFRISGNELKKALDFDHHFGTVFATSGYKTSTTLQCSLDWALVDVQDTRRGENKVCTPCLVSSWFNTDGATGPRAGGCATGIPRFVGGGCGC